MGTQVYGGLDAAFWEQRPLIGMVHLLALPGSPGDTGQGLEPVIKRAVADARALEAGGASAVIIENFFDAPFAKECVPPHTVAAMTRAVLAVRRATQLPLGVNVLRNDARSALAIANICDAQFIRVNVWVGAAVTDQGIIEGAARQAILYRRELGANVAIFADIFVKHAAQLGTGTIEDAARDAVYRGQADALIVTGAATGSGASAEDVQRIKTALPDVRLLVGSGLDRENAAALMAHADGGIAGTSLKHDGIVSSAVDAERVRALRETMPGTA